MDVIESLESIPNRISRTIERSDTILEYSKVYSYKRVMTIHSGFHIPEDVIREEISRVLAEHLLKEGCITFKKSIDFLGDEEIVGSINIFDMNKFNERYRPEYLV